MGPVAIILSFVLSFIMAYYIWRKRKVYLISFQLNGPLAYPIIGNASHFIGDTRDLMQRFMNLSQIYGKPMRIWFGSTLVIYFCHPKQIEKILTSSKMTHKGELYRILQIYLGDGLISNTGGKKYKQHRKLIQPLINLKFISENIDNCQKHIYKLTKVLKKYQGAGTFDVFKPIHHYFTDVIGEIILGIDIKALDGENNEYIEAVLRMYDVGYERLSKPWLNADFIFNLTPQKKVQDYIQNTINEFTKKAIRQSRERVLKNENQDTDTTPIIDKITKIINDEPGMFNEMDFVHHMFTLYAASQDTTAFITIMLCVCMGMYPEYQKKAVDEIREIIGENPVRLDAEILYKMHYLDMCIREVLRIIPIAALILRKTTEDFEIDNWVIPKGIECAISIFEVHRDPEHWENPLHFHPDHFLPEAVNNRHPYAFIPFSAGGRSCIGKQLAMIMIKVAIINILQEFEIEADGKFPDVKLKSDITVRSANGYKIRLNKRVWN